MKDIERILLKSKLTSLTTQDKDDLLFSCLYILHDNEIIRSEIDGNKIRVFWDSTGDDIF